MNRKILAVLIISGLIVIVIWIWQNPIGRFGYHSFGFTVYSSIPFPYFDLKIYTNGFLTIRAKSHFVSMEEVSDLIDADVIVIGTGYDEMVKVDEKIFNLTVKVEALETSEAIKKFNELIDENKKVAAIIHSTC